METWAIACDPHAPAGAGAIFVPEASVPSWAALAAVAAPVLLRPELGAGLCAALAALGWMHPALAAAALGAGMLLRTARAWRKGTNARDAGVATPAMRSWARELGQGPYGAMLRTRLQPWRRDEGAFAAGACPGASPARVGGVLAGSAIWSLAAFAPTFAAAAWVRGSVESGALMLALLLLTAAFVPRIAVLACTWTGRRRLLASLTRAAKHEFWPAWAYYAPLALWLPWLALRHRGPMTFTCANPAIGMGGGVVGESKLAILRALAPEGVLRVVEIPPGEPRARLALLLDAMSRDRPARGFPIVLKPDTGQRGYAVRIARDQAHALDYLARMGRTVVAQQYHPGPVEVGVMWVRDPEATRGRMGRIFSLTSKHLPDLAGDGVHTIEQLIYRHPRLRCQADTLLTRLAGKRLDVPAPGERVGVVSVGNHCQGAIFRDGAEHVTPELEAWIDRAAAAFHVESAGAPLPPGDNGLDFGRFDIRAASVERLRRAEGLAIIELNGTTAESTNIYDPDRSLLWSWGVLLRQWALLYRLGAGRRAMGVRPMGPLELRRAWREFDRDRPAMRVAD